MAVGVDQERVVFAPEDGQHSEVGLVASGEEHAGTTSKERGELAFQASVQSVRPVRDPRTCRAAAEVSKRIGGRRQAFGIVAEAEIVVGPEQQGRPSVDHAVRRGDRVLDHHPERIARAVEQGAPRFRQRGEPSREAHRAIPIDRTGPAGLAPFVVVASCRSLSGNIARGDLDPGAGTSRPDVTT